jgi:clan AA aspartic protease (TIGR02281 family)
MPKRLGLLCAVLFLGNVAAFAQGGSEAKWRSCQSSDADERLRGCTAVINASGFGSQSKLADAFDGRCWAYHTKEQFRRAIEDCKASIRIRPDYPYAYNNLGTAYAGLSDYTNAIVAFNTAIELKPEFFWSRYNRAKVFVALGQVGNAVNDYEYLLRRDPSNQDVKDQLQRLQASTSRSSSSSASPPTPTSHEQPKPDTSASSESFSVAMRAEGGIFVVPVLINGAITLDFVVDSGASDVSIPADVVSTLIRTRTIAPSDFIGTQTYVLADGSKAPSDVFTIRSLKVGGHVVENVRASIAPPDGTLLLGQSFLLHFNSWSIDNAKHALILHQND